MKYLINVFIIFWGSIFVFRINALAQNENVNWHFGWKVGMDFRQLPPTESLSSITTMESSVAVSDAAGNLLFYTTGNRVWDKNNNLMPNGTMLLGNGPMFVGSSKYGTQVIRNPSNPNIYYVFSADAFEDFTSNLYYHVVDMNLNNGLGDVVATEKDILLLNEVSECISVFKGADCESYWLVGLRLGSNPKEYFSYKIDNNGVNTSPVITQVTDSNFFPSYWIQAVGGTGKGIAPNLGGFVIVDFNGFTGTFSNFDTLKMENVGEIQFSKDLSKLYMLSSIDDEISQFDYTLLSNKNAFRNSKYSIVNNVPSGVLISDLRMAVNGDLYVLQIDSNVTNKQAKLGRLSNANLAGASTVYEPNYQILNNTLGIHNYFNLGIDIQINDAKDTIFHPMKDTLVCVSESASLHSSNTTAQHYEWSNGTTGATSMISGSGVYWVKAMDFCKVVIDSFNVEWAAYELELPDSVFLCDGATLILNGYHPSVLSYLWNDGSVESTLTISEPGIYTLFTQSEKCSKTDTITVLPFSATLNLSASDTSICSVHPLRVSAHSNMPSTFVWNDGTIGEFITINTTGLYFVEATNSCGKKTYSIFVTVLDCKCQVIVPSAFSPNNDGNNDILVPKVAIGCIFPNYQFSIFNRFGQMIFSSNQPNIGWDGKFNGKNVDVGVYFYRVEYVDFSTKDKTTISGDVTLIR